MDFENKVVIVTGSTDGVGEKILDLLHQRGAKVVVSARTASAVLQKANSLSADQKSALGVVCDVSDPTSVQELIATTVTHFGRLDLAVNCAGMTGEHQKNIDEQSLDNWHAVLQNTLSSVFYCMKYELAAMLKNNKGAIVNLSAVNGLVGIAGLAPYTVAKHGVIGLTKTAALEYASKNIRINAVAPGYVSTPKMEMLPHEVYQNFAMTHPLHRMATRQEVAELVLFLLSEQASFCTGAVYPIDGGYLAQ